MQITEQYFNSILLELIDENPIACRGILRVSEVEFTDEVPTLAITLSGRRPKLCVNLGFVGEHCRTEDHVKAVIVHEFLHVLLNHTERFEEMSPGLNLALDGVINAIIHRTLGETYSGMMSLYYAGARGSRRLLRPVTESDVRQCRAECRCAIFCRCGARPFLEVWKSLYSGKLVVDDLMEIAITGFRGEPGEELAERGFLGNHSNCGSAENGEPGEEHGERGFLGNHSPCGAEEISAESADILRETLASMTGGGIWRSPRDRGVGLRSCDLEAAAKSESMNKWKKEAMKELVRCVTPDKRGPRENKPQPMSLPVLNEGDKRGFLRSLWSPFIPDIVWPTQKKVPRGTTQVYLDVSGSMNREMDALVSLLWRLRRHIRLPFWAFSDSVHPAEIRDGKLVTSTTGGTSMNSVLRHVAETQPGRAVVITDGYIERCNPRLLRAVQGQTIRAIVSRNGSPAELQRAGIPYSQLGRFENDPNG